MFLVTEKAETYSEGERVGGKFIKCLYIVNKKPEKKYILREHGKEMQRYVYTVVEKKDKRGAPLYILNPAKPEDFLLTLKNNVTTGEITGQYSFTVMCGGMLGGEYSVEYIVNEKPVVEKYRELVINSIPDDIEMKNLSDELDLEDCKIRVHYSKSLGVKNPGIRNVEIKYFRRKTGERGLVNDWWHAPSKTYDYQYMADLYSDFTDYETAPDEVKKHIEKLVLNWKDELENSQALHTISTKKDNIRITYFEEMN